MVKMLIFIKNDIDIRSKYNIPYAPRLYNFGEDWLEEEYFTGKPINRISNNDKKKQMLNQIIEDHYKCLNLHTRKKISVERYKKLVENDLVFLLIKNELNINKSVLKLIEKTLSKLFKVFSENFVYVSWTHGDFQQANILVNNEKHKVIDWEASNMRFFLYDIFTLQSNIRSGQILTESINNLRNNIKLLSFLEPIKGDYIILFLIEELRFKINDSFSINYFNSTEKIKGFCNSVLKYLNE